MTDQMLDQARHVVDMADPGRTTVQGFFDEATFTVTYVVSDPATGEAAVVDSVLDFDSSSGRTSTAGADAVIAYVRAQELDVKWLLETHVHADHLSAAPYLQSKIGGNIGISRHVTDVQRLFGDIFNEDGRFERDGSQFDTLFDDGTAFNLGSINAIALHVPGHTPADLAYVIGDAVFIGDTLFMPDSGTARADFPGGDARTLYRSINRLLSLPDRARLFLCHDYKAPGRDEYIWETTVGVQRSDNIHVGHGMGEDEFVAMREARDRTLGMPRLIVPAIQVNMRAGHMPDPEGNGTVYLKLPINRF